MRPRRWAGVDPSLYCTGWAVVEYADKGYEYIASGHIKTKAKDGLPCRLWRIASKLGEELDKYLKHADGIAMEKTAAYAINQNTNRLLHCVQGVTLAASYPRANTIRELHPTQWRKFLGNGHMDKEQVKAVVTTLLGREALAHVSIMDEYEALGIAMAGPSIGDIG